MLTKLRGRSIYHRAVTALFTGLRRGAKMLGVHEALEETKAGIGFKETKTKNGRRDISLPDAVVDVLRKQRREQMEQRKALGLGKLRDDALVFRALDGGPSRPTNLSSGWADVAEAIGLPGVTFHALPHPHA